MDEEPQVQGQEGLDHHQTGEGEKVEIGEEEDKWGAVRGKVWESRPWSEVWSAPPFSHLSLHT